MLLTTKEVGIYLFSVRHEGVIVSIGKMVSNIYDKNNNRYQVNNRGTTKEQLQKIVDKVKKINES